MKKFLMMTLFVMLSIGTFTEDGYGQKLGRLYKSGIQTTELSSNDTDTLYFELEDVLDNDPTLSIWFKVERVSGTLDSITVSQKTSLLAQTLPNSQGDALVTIVADTSVSDNLWNGYDTDILPGIAEFVWVIVKHTELGGTADTSNISVRLLYR